MNFTLTEEKRLELLQLLFRYKHIFARSLEEIKVCKGTPISIDLNSNCKVFKRQIRLNEIPVLPRPYEAGNGTKPTTFNAV